MTCKEMFVNGVNEKCFSCKNCVRCISDYAQYIDSERVKYADSVNVIACYSEWAIYYEGECIYTIDDSDGSVSGNLFGCEYMCDVVEVARDYVNAMNEERLEASKPVFSSVALAAITSQLAEAWYLHYSIGDAL